MKKIIWTTAALAVGILAANGLAQDTQTETESEHPSHMDQQQPTQPQGTQGTQQPTDRQQQQAQQQGQQAQQQAAGGWEKDSQYGRLFEPNAVQTVSGTVTATRRRAPMPGMASGVELMLRSEDGNNLTVHVGPAWFIDRQPNPIAPRDRVEVTGSRVELEGAPIIMATRIRRDDRVLELREEDGSPVWEAWQPAASPPTARR